MKKLIKKLNTRAGISIFLVAFAILLITPGVKVNAQSYDGAYDSNYGSYDSGYGSYDSGYGSYDSGYGSYDSGYGSYDSGYGYGSSYDSGYNYNSGYGSSYDSGYGSYYGGYDSGCSTCGGTGYTWNSGGSNNNCNNCNYVPPCTTCNPPPCTTCNPPPVIPDLHISCTPNSTNINVNDSVTWTSNASGGSGSYSYSWSGTDGLSGSGSQINKSYSSSGSKSAHVTVTSGNKTASADCGTVYVAQQQQNLSGSCTVNSSNINRGDSVNWTANASGGDGSYTYEWTGDSPLSGRSGSNVSVNYDTTGTKYGSVIIRSNGQSITRSCGTVYVNDNNYHPYNYNSLNVSCNVNNANITPGQSAVWNAYATGGNGNYYYSWTGTDGIYGNGSVVSKIFNTPGTKTATVTVTSDGQSKSLNCPMTVVGAIAYNNPNQGNLASLSSVYLNQVPYTGVGDNPKLLAFIISLLLLSGFGAYYIVLKRAKSERKNKILDFKRENMLKMGIKQ